MNVVIVSHTGETSGSNQVVRMLTKYRPDFLQLRVIFLRPGPNVEAVAQLGAEVEVIESGRARNLLRAPRVVNQIRARAKDADLLFSHVSKAQIYGGVAARLANTPSVWYQHELPGKPKGLQSAAAMTRPAAVVANSRFVAKLHEKRWPRQRLIQVYPGIEHSSPRPRTDSGSGVVFGVVSRIDRWKRIDLAIDNFAAVASDLPGSELRIFGGLSNSPDAREHENELRALAASRGVADRVHLAGHVDDVDGALAELDIVLHFSENEPFGLSVVEAMSQGLPVIASSDGGASEIVVDGETGFLVDPLDAGATAALMSRLATDSELRRTFGERGASRAREVFDAKTNSLELWDRVLELRKSGD